MNPNIPTPEGTVKRGLSGPTVHFNCPACASHLNNPLCDAGRPDRCPDCGAGYIVPGAAEWEAMQAERRRDADRRRAAEVDRLRDRAERAKHATRSKGPEQGWLNRAYGFSDRAKRLKPIGLPLQCRVVGGGMLIVSTLGGLATAVQMSVSGPTDAGLFELISAVGYAVSNAALFIGGTLFYALGHVLQALYQIRDAGSVS